MLNTEDELSGDALRTDGVGGILGMAEVEFNSEIKASED